MPTSELKSISLIDYFECSNIQKSMFCFVSSTHRNMCLCSQNIHFSSHYSLHKCARVHECVSVCVCIQHFKEYMQYEWCTCMCLFHVQKKKKDVCQLPASLQYMLFYCNFIRSLFYPFIYRQFLLRLVCLCAQLIKFTLLHTYTTGSNRLISKMV